MLRAFPPVAKLPDSLTFGCRGRDNVNLVSPGHRPVFHDPSGRRMRWTLRIAVALGAAFLALCVVFLVSLVAVPVLPRTIGISEPVRRALRPHLPSPPLSRDARLPAWLVARERRRLLDALAHERRRTKTAEPAPAAGAPVTGAFYATWQETGLHSLRANASHLTHLFPLWLRLSLEGDHLDTRDWNLASTPHNLDVLRICREHHLRVMPVLSNAHDGVFDPAVAHRLLIDPAHQDTLARELGDWLVAHGCIGVNLDLENLAHADLGRVPPFVARLHRALARRNLSVSIDLEAEGEVPDAGAVAKACDFIVLMAYDEHFMNGDAGPLAGVGWLRDVIDRTRREVPGEKLVLGIGNYAYDWTEGRAPAEPMSYQEALYLASDQHPELAPADVVDFDSLSFQPTFQYDDEQGREHEVWMLDAVTAANSRSLALQRGVRGTALWVLGEEDPSVWSLLDRRHPDAPADSLALARTAFPYDVEFEGDGELLTVAAWPQPGERVLEVDHASGLFTDESYRRYPSSYLIQRHGFRDSCLALTFDDGPSDVWTPKLLDTLHELHVPATFFVVGANAERHPELITREWRDGHEIGNHSYTHPNLAAMSPRAIRLELNATQRVLQSTLGHSTLLFRPPYNADAEPTSAEEVAPMLEAARLGYATVGEYIDPQDWRLRTPEGQLRGPQDIADAVVERVASGHGNTVLLHDGGGDRHATIEAIRRFVPELRARGYRFVTVSELSRETRAQVMPAVSPRDRALLGGDRVAFDLLWFGQTVLQIAFLSGLVLGTLRVLFMTTLAVIAAWRQRRRERRLAASAAPAPPAPVVRASVVIAAYHEAPVINRTIAAVLASHVAPFEIIVVDDGSTDGTADVVLEEYGHDPRVHVLRQANAGKAAALNRGIAIAQGDVLVCLDADTLFAPGTLGALVAPFVDPRIGAVAGNVKVGNRINVWTRWQALEYITSQNLDRRAYAALDAITVVPGAVGAWRKDAVAAVGGFVSDTLAEDMDLTWRLRRAGWRITNEPRALGFTEAPDSLGTLYRQRFRWSFGTLQCLWKHRDAVGHVGWFGRLALPSLWVFQIVFPILSPIIDLQVLITLLLFVQGELTRGLLTQDWQPLPAAVESLSTVGFLYLFFFLLELAGASIAIRLEREKKGLLWWLFWQRFVYRQVMYAVVWRAVRTAVTGRMAGWGKLERKNTAVVDPA